MARHTAYLRAPADLGRLEGEARTPVDGEMTLAPVYDVVPHAHLPGDGRMALAANGKYRHIDLTRADLLAEFTSWGVRHASVTIDETLEQLRSAVEHEAALEGAPVPSRADPRLRRVPGRTRLDELCRTSWARRVSLAPGCEARFGDRARKVSFRRGYGGVHPAFFEPIARNAPDPPR